MKITGSSVVPAPVDAVWDALLDPQVLVNTIPGCSRMESTGEHSYAMTVTAGVAAIKGTYDGTCELSDLVAGESLVMKLSGAGAPGTIDASVNVGFAAVDGGTQITYDADAVVGGMVGGVGQRMLTSVSKRMAGEFFGNVAGAITAPSVVEPGSGPVAEPVDGAQEPPRETTPLQQKVFTPAVRPAGDSETLVKGMLIGAGLVLAGVLAGRLLGRR